MDVKRVEHAMQNLELEDYRGINLVFGSVLRTRSRAAQQECAWFNMLADRSPVCNDINRSCELYLKEVGAEDSRKKAEADLLGPAGSRSVEEFQKSLGDFYSELSAVIELSKIGFRDFRAVFGVGTKKRRLSSYDYSGLGPAGQPVCIEVKHVNSPITVPDVLFSQLRWLQSTRPTDYPFTIRIEYPNDNTASEEKKGAISNYLEGLPGTAIPTTAIIPFSDGTAAQITVLAGTGTAHSMRLWSIDDPDTLNKEGFLRKVHDSASKAANQLKGVNCDKVLVLDVTTPTAVLDAEYVHAALDIVREVNESLRTFVLHYGHLVRTT